MATRTPDPVERAKQINDDLKAAEAARADAARKDAEEGDTLDRHGEHIDKLLKCMD